MDFCITHEDALRTLTQAHAISEARRLDERFIAFMHAHLRVRETPGHTTLYYFRSAF